MPKAEERAAGRVEERAAGRVEERAAGRAGVRGGYRSGGAASVHAKDRRALIRYRVLAYTTATLLIILVFAGVPLQVWYHNLWIVEVVGTLHGYLYLVYLLVAFDFTRRMRVPILKMMLVLLAGTVPFAAIVAERLLTRRYEARLATGEQCQAARSAPATDQA